MAQLKRGPNPAHSLHTDEVHYSGALIGGGAASACTVDTTNRSARNNLVSSCAYTSTGLYVATFKEFPTNILSVTAHLQRAAGTTLVAAVRSWSTSAKTVTFDVRDNASSAAVADATTSDRITIHVWASNSGA